MGITAGFGVLPPHLRRTLTWDQGKELALQHQITASVGTRVCSCDVHSPWQQPYGQVGPPSFKRRPGQQCVHNLRVQVRRRLYQQSR